MIAHKTRNLQLYVQATKEPTEFAHKEGLKKILADKNSSVVVQQWMAHTGTPISIILHWS